MGGFLLRLAGPMQSWGEHSAFGTRDTLAFPSRSGLIGMFAAARGLPRGADLSRYDPLTTTVRVDNPGLRMVDFHTVGGGLPADRTVPTAEGKRKSAETATIVTHRGYLAGAVFTVAVTAPDELAEQITSDLVAPYWPPYLGRRSHVPDPPLLLRARVDDPVAELYTRVPLPMPTQANERRAATLSRDFVYEGEGEAGVETGAGTHVGAEPSVQVETTVGGAGEDKAVAVEMEADADAGTGTRPGAGDGPRPDARGDNRHGHNGDPYMGTDTGSAASLPASDRPRSARAERSVLSDIPRTFHAQRRQYATRAVTVLPRPLPRELFHWRNHGQYLDALYDYARQEG